MGNKLILAAAAMAVLTSSCNMENPLLVESTLPYGAPDFDNIKIGHYMPAIKQGIKEAKAEIDAIVNNPEAPTFENTIEALEYSGATLDRVCNIFYNLMECNTNDEMQKIAEEATPLMTEYSMYISLNKPLFERIKAVYEQRNELGLEPDQMKLLENSYKSFSRNGANLEGEDKELYQKYSEEMSLLTLQFSKNVLAASNDYVLNITDSSRLGGLPEYVMEMGAETAREKDLEGWAFTLDYPSMSPFLKFSTDRELRREIWTANSSKAVGGEFDNTEIVKKIVDLRIKTA